MATVTVNATPQVQVTQYGAGILSGVAVNKTETFRSLFTSSGVAADQCDTLHIRTYAFAASTPQTIDLLSLLDIFGAPAVFARVRLLAIKLVGAADGQALLLGGAGANEWDGFLSPGAKVSVFPGTAAAGNDGYLILAAPGATGVPVLAGSHLLKLDPGAGAFSAEVVVAGASA